MPLPEYRVMRVECPPSLSSGPSGPGWSDANVITIASFHPRGSSHQPETQVRLLYDTHALYGLFHVDDRYIRCTHTEFQSEVYRDACAECFLKPRLDRGYFNFEMNCCGALLCRYIEDPARMPGNTFRKQTPLDREHGRRIVIHSPWNHPLPEEIPGPLSWDLGFSIPFEVIEAYTGPLGDLQGQVWRANFYKCAEDNSHPHWGYWADIGERLDFHQPDRFGILHFD